MMHNIKSIRKNPDFFKKKFSERNFNIKLDHLLNLDKTNRNLIEKKEKSEQEKKSISQKKDKKLFLKSKDLSTKIESLAEEQIKVQIEINNILMSAPNIALDDVPVGVDDKANLLVRKVGEVKKFSFLPRSHFEIGQKLNLMDFNLATKTSGTRFVFLKRDLALLERAISNFMLDIHTKDFGYQEISPPLIANESTMFGTGQLPKFESDQFEIKLDEENIRKFLIPTAEVILTNIVRESFINIDELPLRFVASTPCFRKEAGSYGKDTKGMIRQHQFYKVELVSIVNPENCFDELNRMTECAQEILKKLKLPYRLIQLSTGDMGFSAEKTFDLEVWIPSENQYREVSSCSSCGQFQAKRMKTKYKNKKNESDFVGTLNGSGLAIGRTLIAIMENYQEKDGSITIPDVLIPYMHGKNSIR